MSLPTEKHLCPHADSSSATGSDQLLRALHHAEPLEQQGPLVPYTAISRVPFWGGGLVPYTANSRILFWGREHPLWLLGLPTCIQHSSSCSIIPALSRAGRMLQGQEQAPPAPLPSPSPSCHPQPLSPALGSPPTPLGQAAAPAHSPPRGTVHHNMLAFNLLTQAIRRK